jgi:branched-chain amino acid transport system ATP-binding protein
MTPALEVDQVSVAFAGVKALSGVSFTVDPGEVVGLIGPNGAGKTTLFDVISGLRRPDSGKVFLSGQDVTRRSAVYRSRAGLRRTFQRQRVFATLTAEDNLLAAVEWHGKGGGIAADMLRLPWRRRLEKSRREELRPLLADCGLSEYGARPAGALPIGGARMVELARAAADHPKVVLLDEPTSGLGELEVALLSQRIKALRQGDNCAVLLIEHDISFVMEHSSRIVALERGTVLAQGPAEHIRNNQAVQDAYLS